MYTIISESATGYNNNKTDHSVCVCVCVCVLHGGYFTEVSKGHSEIRTFRGPKMKKDVTPPTMSLKKPYPPYCKTQSP